MNIEEASRISGVSQRMIRHYEQVGAIPPPRRRPSGHRVYDDADVGRLRFAAAARAVGFELPEIAAMLRLWGEEDGDAAVWLAELRRKKEIVSRLEAMIDEAARGGAASPRYPGAG